MAQAQPTQPVLIDRWFTGLVSHRNPLMTPFTFVGLNMIERKDALLGGLNAELTDLFTIRRRYGFSTYSGSLTGGQALRNAQSFKDLTGSYHVAADLTTNVATLTAGGITNLFAESAGSSQCSMQLAGNSVYFANGVDQQKWVFAGPWVANAPHNLGDMIIDSNGNAQVVEATATANISQVQVVSSHLGLPLGPLHYFLKVTFATNVNWASGTPVTFSGLTTYTALNNKTLPVVVSINYLTPAPNVAYFGAIINTLYGPAADTGSASSTGNQQTVSSGAVQPTWASTLGATTSDGNLTWTCFGFPLYNWQMAAPTQAPILLPNPVIRYWQSNSTLSLWYSILDPNNNVQVAINSIGSFLTGATAPVWNTAAPSLLGAFGGQTSDGNVVWQNCGPIGTWIASQKFIAFQCISDPNGNLQILTGGSGGNSGGSAPTWASTVGTTTTDGALTWTCVGAGTVLATAPLSYWYAWHAIDGSVTSLSPKATLNPSGSILGPVNSYLCLVQGTMPSDPQCDQTWVFRTLNGGSTPFYAAAVTNNTPGSTSTFGFSDSLPDASLNILIVGPQNNINNPPPTGITNICFYAGRVWGSVAGTGYVYFASGPDATTGNPETSWSPLNYFLFPGTVTKLKPIPGGLLVYLEDDLYEIVGTTLSTFQPILSQSKLGVSNPDAVETDGGTVYTYTSLGQLWATGNSTAETGFNIADQLAAHFPPASTSIKVLRNGINESALYVSGGNGFMLRYSLQTQSWSPLWQIAAGMSKQWVVAIGPQQYILLGQIGNRLVKRDTTLFTDLGVTYTWSFLLGTLRVATPGHWCVEDFISIHKSAQGSLPTISYLPDDLGNAMFSTLGDPQNEPPELPQNINLFGHRWYFLTNQGDGTDAAPTVMQHIQVNVAFPAENFSNEIYALGIIPRDDEEE